MVIEGPTRGLLVLDISLSYQKFLYDVYGFFFAFYSLDKECNGVAFQHQSTRCGQILLVHISPRHGKNRIINYVLVIMGIR